MKTSFMILIFISLLSISGIKSIAYADAVVDKEFVWRTDEEVMAIYEKWMLEHDKVYNGLREEKLKRFEIFKDNLKYMEEHNNLLNQTYKLGLNQFSDLTLDEFKSIYLINTPIDTLNESEIDFSYIPELNYSLRLPDSIDWRKQGAVVPIKDQGSCGSCWAFSAISAVEALNKIKRGVLISLSEQMLVDCVKRATYGCNGGRQTDAFQYMTDHGIASSGDYPYKQVQGPTCQNNKIVVKLGGYRNIVPRREDYLQLITSMQVVSVMVKSGSKDFQHYKSGIFSGKCGDEVDHAVTVVGYGSENGNAYWIVRNSWATTWGEQGYMRMPRNIKNDEGYCGIALWPSFPVMNSIHEGNINIL